MRDEWNDTVTVYNRCGDGSWRLVVLHGVAVLESSGEAVRHAGAASSSARRIGAVSVGELTVIIPCAGRVGYLPPQGWQWETERAGSWTLQAGDIVVLGVSTTPLGSDSEALLSAGVRFATINAVTDYRRDQLLAHWEVSAR